MPEIDPLTDSNVELLADITGIDDADKQTVDILLQIAAAHYINLDFDDHDRYFAEYVADEFGDRAHEDSIQKFADGELLPDR